MRTDELDFHLPPELIAQEPTPERHGSRLLHYNPGTRDIRHLRFTDLPSLLRPGDLLVFNDTRVLPARFVLQKPTKGLIDGLFLEELRSGRWRVLLRNVGRYTGPLHFEADPTITVKFIAGEAGEYEIDVVPPAPAQALLERLGRMPLPPYIKRQRLHDERDRVDRQRYQTVFAREASSVAAPTAALHFSPEVLSALAGHGVEQAFVTLEVGMGTFKPVSADTLDAHAMHTERYSISGTAAEAINAARSQGRRVIAVGTTATRVLESQPEGPIEARSGSTAIFIYPPYRWKHVGGLVTNFHLPRSTLIALVAARVGLEEQRRIYAEAIAEGYRFFSYGDAMYIGEI